MVLPADRDPDVGAALAGGVRIGDVEVKSVVGVPAAGRRPDRRGPGRPRGPGPRRRGEPTAARSAPNDPRSRVQIALVAPPPWLASNRAQSCRPEDGRARGGRAMVRGSGSGRTTGRAHHRPGDAGASCQRRVRSGAVRWGRWADRPTALPRLGHTHRGWPRAPSRHASHHHGRSEPERPGSVMGGTLIGTLLVIGGLWLAYVAWSTPILRPSRPRRPGAGPAEPGLPMLALALAVPARSSWSARTDSPGRFAAIRRAWHGRGDRLVAGPARRHRPRAGLILDDGRPGPTLLAGAFGSRGTRDQGRRSRTTSTGHARTPIASAAGSARTTRTSSSGSTPRDRPAGRRSPGARLRAHHRRTAAGLARVAAPPAQPERGAPARGS